MKLFTEVNCEKLSPLSRGEKICVLGSCFADAIGEKLAAAGFDVLRNPFGTLYNPASVATAVERLDSARPFTADECVEMGAGAGLVCSFAHHTRFARPTPEAFLDAANAALAADAAAWAGCRRVIVTLGTAWVWRALERPGRPVVANCLKRPAREFAHELLGVDACAALLRSLVEDHPDKQFLFTVSPIRHLGDGAHANTLSKSTLQLAVQQVVTAFSNPSSSPAAVPSSCLAPTGHLPRAEYFPAYEILLDELRDYRFYADDLVHPADHRRPAHLGTLPGRLHRPRRPPGHPGRRARRPRRRPPSPPLSPSPSPKIRYRIDSI